MQPSQKQGHHASNNAHCRIFKHQIALTKTTLLLITLLNMGEFFLRNSVSFRWQKKSKFYGIWTLSKSILACAMNLLTQLHILLLLMKVEVLTLVIQLFSRTSRLALGLTQPHIYWVPGALSTGVKWPPPTANVKNEWTYTSTPPYAFMQCTGKTMHFLCNLPVCNVMHSKQPAFSTIMLLPWRQKQQGALECCYIPTDYTVSHPRGP